MLKWHINNQLFSKTVNFSPKIIAHYCFKMRQITVKTVFRKTFLYSIIIKFLEAIMCSCALIIIENIMCIVYALQDYMRLKE